MKKIKTTCLGAALLALILSQAALAQDAEIRILCSNGFRGAMLKLVPQGQRAAGHAVKIEYGPSAKFKQAIEGGEQFDLLIVTPRVIGALVKEGKITAGTQVDLASSGIGIAVRATVPKPDISSAQAIKKTLLDAKSIGYVKVGAGTPAILDMLNSLGIGQEVQRKTALQEGAESSMKNVAEGKVDVAFALISEIVPAPGVQLAGPVPPEFQRKVVMTAGVSSSTKQRDAVSGIIKSLSSDAAAAKIKAAGLDPIH
jgi:molybdate transport system substrate-binding protein